MKDYISEDQIIIDFLIAVRSQTVQFESEMVRLNCYLCFDCVVHVVGHHHRLY
jgi:hypothetical protein